MASPVILAPAPGHPSPNKNTSHYPKLTTPQHRADKDINWPAIYLVLIEFTNMESRVFRKMEAGFTIDLSTAYQNILPIWEKAVDSMLSPRQAWSHSYSITLVLDNYLQRERKRTFSRDWNSLHSKKISFS